MTEKINFVVILINESNTKFVVVKLYDINVLVVDFTSMVMVQTQTANR